MDGNVLASHPANFTALGEPQPTLAATLEEWQMLSDNAQGLPQAATTLDVVAPVTSPALPSSGLGARELLEELHTGRLTAEQAFLERAHPAMAELATAPVAPGASTASPTMPAARAIPAPMPMTEAAPPLPLPAPAVVPSQASVVEQLVEKHLIVSLGDSRYAVPMDHIVEIAELAHYTPVPNVPDWVLGITNLRGDILSLVDLNALQGEASDEIPRGSSLLVAQTIAGDLTLCLVVDRVYGVMNVVPDQIQKLDQMMNHGLSAFSRGFVSDGGELVCLLEVESLLRSLEFRQ